MKERNYDVLPVKSVDGKYDSFYELDDNEAVLKHIDGTTNIYYLTDLEDLLNQFTQKGSRYFFLTDYEKVVGLVSTVNLNAKAVNVYFYALLSSLEIELSRLLKEMLPEQLIYELIANGQSKNDEEVIKRFKDDESNNEASHILDYLYLSQYKKIIRKLKLWSWFGYASRVEGDNELDVILKYRNYIAHPTKKRDVDFSFKLHGVIIAIRSVMKRVAAIDATLLQCHVRTDYVINGGAKITIHPCQYNHKLNEYLKTQNINRWALIAAMDPESNELLEEPLNSRLNADLEKYLTNTKLNFNYGEAISDINIDCQPIASYFIHNITRENAIKLGNQFRQKAIVFGERDAVAEIIILNSPTIFMSA